MFRARNACAPFSTHFNLVRTRPFCSSIKDGNNNKNKKDVDGDDGKIDSNVSTYNESYRQLENLDFTTAAKILFTQPPKKKKFGIDFHLVQLFFACMPSLAVYLVAQYARYEMRKMEAELEEKKKQEEEAKRKQEEEEEEEEKKKQELEKAKEREQVAIDPELSEVKLRLGKLEEAVKEIVVESKKQSAERVIKSQKNAGEDKSTSESCSSMEQDKVTKQTSAEQTPSTDEGKVVSDASEKDLKGEKQIGGHSQDAGR